MGSPQKGWTGNIPNRASSSHRSSSDRRVLPPPDDEPPELGPGMSDEVEAFAEKFKYLVCASGLLEKDHVPCLASRSRGHHALASEEDGTDDADPDSGPDPALASSVGTRDHALIYYAYIALRYGKQRPDVALAVTVLIGAGGWLVGWKVALTVIAIVVTLTPVLRIGRRHLVSPESGDPGRHGQVQESEEIASTVAKSDDTFRSSVMTSLHELLDTSQSLDHAVEASLSLLSTDADSLEAHHPLRVALHRMNEQSTDHLATATSTLLEMVDKDELGVLGEMYDIPVVGGSHPPRRRAASRGVDDEPLHLPSPKRLSWNASKPLFPLSLPMGTSASMPSRLTPGKKHAAHQSLSGLPVDDDRYTSIPRRTPRKSKRSSWAPEWNDRIKFDDGANPGATTADQPQPDGPAAQAQEMSRHSSSDGDRSREVPVTPVVPLYTPRRSSPLSRPDWDRVDDQPKRHIFPIIPPTPLKSPLQPSPMAKSPTATTGQSKRTSLQSMPYYRSDQSDIASPGKASVNVNANANRSIDLGRAQPLQYSDLQSLRDQSTHGSRRSSVSAGIGLGPALPLFASVSPVPDRPKVQRLPSLSPLTLTGLRAACLGIHMKRRRMACCLLGLRFEEDDEYWSIVQDVLAQLSSNISREVADLSAALEDAKAADTVSSPANHSESKPAPWLNDNPSQRANGDFAPRTSDQARLNEHVETMERTLHDAWTSLQAIRTSEGHELPTAWADVRSQLGLLVREWERAKETVNKLASPLDQGHAFDSDVDEAADQTSATLPPFMRAWDDEDDEPEPALNRSLSTTSPISDTPAEHPIEHDRMDPEQLPPPGQDIVFESLPAAVGLGIERSKLSREERIKLMKEARDKGMTLTELLGQREDPDKGENRKVLAMGGDVVAELNGMIGMIRRRKGLSDTERTEGPEPATGAPIPVSSVRTAPDRQSRPPVPPGLADELRKAFVFPTPRVNGHSDH